jgi:uncharacterized protein YecT (DUF1311 family)
MRFFGTLATLLLSFAASTVLSSGSSSNFSASAPCDSNSSAGMNQMQLSECWGTSAKHAAAELATALAQVTSGLSKLGIDPKPLGGISAAWSATRDKTCTFEYGLAAGGSIAPMLYSECLDRMTRACTARLRALLESARAKGAISAAQPVSSKVDAELNRVYGLLAKRVTSAQRDALAASEVAWISYRDKACAFEGGTCLTDLEQERIAELEAGYMGERFW